MESKKILCYLGWFRGPVKSELAPFRYHLLLKVQHAYDHSTLYYKQRDKKSVTCCIFLKHFFSVLFLQISLQNANAKNLFIKKKLNFTFKSKSGKFSVAVYWWPQICCRANVSTVIIFQKKTNNCTFYQQVFYPWCCIQNVSQKVYCHYDLLSLLFCLLCKYLRVYHASFVHLSSFYNLNFNCEFGQINTYNQFLFSMFKQWFKMLSVILTPVGSEENLVWLIHCQQDCSASLFR